MYLYLESKLYLRIKNIASETTDSLLTNDLNSNYLRILKR